MQAAFESVFWDECVRLIFTEGAIDDGGKLAITYPDGNTQLCVRDILGSKLNWRGSAESREMRLTTTQFDAVLRVSLDEVWGYRDRVRITHVHGTLLDPALLFDITGHPQRAIGKQILLLQEAEV